MEVVYENDDLERLEIEPAFNAKLSRDLVKAFRKRMQIIRAAVDERDFYPLRGLRFEPLKGKRAGEYSMRLNDQFRLVMRLEKRSTETVVVIRSIEDYH